MAIKVNDSNEKVVKDFTLYKGAAKFKVLAINPNLAKLQELGFNFQQEPTYVSEEDGVKKVRLDFIVGNDKVKNKIVFFLEKRERENNAKDKFEFINNFGMNTWCTTLEEALAKTGKNGKQWFKPNGARKALVGEVALIQFLQTWLNTNLDDEVYIEKIDALFNGNVSELAQYVNLAKNNEFWALLTVTEKDGKNYQNINSDIFVRASFKDSTAKSKFVEYAKKQAESGYAIKGYQGADFEEYVPQDVVITPDTDVSVATTDDF